MANASSNSNTSCGLQRRSSRTPIPTTKTKVTHATNEKAVERMVVEIEAESNRRHEVLIGKKEKC